MLELNRTCRSETKLSLSNSVNRIRHVIKEKDGFPRFSSNNAATSLGA